MTSETRDRTSDVRDQHLNQTSEVRGQWSVKIEDRRILNRKDAKDAKKKYNFSLLGKQQ